MTAQILQGDALDVLRSLPDSSVDAVVTDPPYFKVKNLEWDRQWDKPQAFIAWIGELADEWRRILKPNGSLYCFASPKMAARVEVAISERFNVLNRIVWAKNDGTYNKGGLWSRTSKDVMRSFFPQTEYIIFAEHYGADNIAKGEAGYQAKCDELRGFVFEPIRLYLRGEFERAGVKTDRANEFCGTASMAGRHYFTRSQWCLPTAPHYRALQEGLNREGRRPAPPFERFHAAPRDRYERDLRADYEDLRADYEDLRADYEDLRRPFSVTADVPYTDVWDFPTVQAYKGKHPCEKPQALLSHIIRSSTREGALVLDCFAGSGSTGEAALRLGRQFIGIEIDPHWVERAQARLASVADVAPVSEIAEARVRIERKQTAQRPLIENLPLFAALTA